MSERRRLKSNPYLTAFSTAVCAVLASFYIVRPDPAAALVAWPVWLWPSLATVCLLPLHRLITRRAAIFLIFIWLVFLLVFAEEPTSLLRGARPQSVGAGAIRVVSLNCDAGNVDAAQEVVPLRPDIVLLQESPDKRHVEELARRMFGRDSVAVWSTDTSILARGKLISTSVRSGHCFVLARIKTAEGREVEVGSVRLSPPVFRIDLWSPECWRQYAIKTQAHRREVLELSDALKTIPQAVPIIVGGDMNCPQGDAALRALSPRLSDAFRHAGAGWGNTVTNTFPVLRFDQIWKSADLRAISVTAHRSENSDHRAVVCDLAFR